MDTARKKCPMCAEEIPLAAITCEYCGTQFTITSSGYCQNCHQVRAANENGQCKVCGNTVMDLRVESKFIEEPVQAPPPVSQPIAQTKISTTGKSPLPIGILVGILIFAAIGAFLWFGRNSLPAVSSLFATSTSTATATFTSTSTPTATPTVTPTHTPRPTPTETPIPAWVNDFADPIFSIIQNRKPSFEDDFSKTSGLHNRWGQCEGCTTANGFLTMMVVNGNASAGGPLKATDFVVQVEFIPKTMSRNSNIGIVFRNGANLYGNKSYYYYFWFTSDGRLTVEKATKGGSTVSVFYSGHTTQIGQGITAKILIMASGDQVAIYLNDLPLTSFHDAYSGNWNSITIGSDPGTTEVDIDNVKFWTLPK